MTVRVNPDVQHGWGIRPNDWQFGVAVQQQIVPRVALDVSYNRARSILGATDNYYTFASDYGDITTYWHGVDAQVSGRLSNRLFVQLGSSGGRGVRDYCAVADKLPELYTTAGSALLIEQRECSQGRQPCCQNYHVTQISELPPACRHCDRTR